MFVKEVIKRSLNFNFPVKIGNKIFIIPIRKGTGIRNLKLGNDWFLYLLKCVTIPKNSYFIDVGVNVGQTILKFRSNFDNPYLGFELNSNCVRYTRQLIKLNNIKDISIFPVGLSNDDEIVVMYSNKDIDNCCTDSTIVQDLRPNRYGDNDKSYAPVYKFDHLKLLKPEDSVSLIKIDVEGAELEVVEGMVETIRKSQPIITCEVLDYDSPLSAAILQERANKLYDFMQNLNYEVYAIRYEDSGLTFEHLSKIKLNPWTPASLDKNDYLFVPTHSENINLDLHHT